MRHGQQRPEVNWEVVMDAQRDSDSIETQVWLDALAAVIAHRGRDRANFIVMPPELRALWDRKFPKTGR